LESLIQCRCASRDNPFSAFGGTRNTDLRGGVESAAPETSLYYLSLSLFLSRSSSLSEKQ
jgi:hypothetical protein